MHVISIEELIHYSKKALISGLDVKKVTIFIKYEDFADVFSYKSAKNLPKHFGINNHLIALEKDKQSLYEQIFRLKLMKLEILKTNIKINLANSFIKPLKSLVNAVILFIYKKIGSF